MIQDTIPKMFLSVCDRFAGDSNKIAFSQKRDGSWKGLSHDELRMDVECLAVGLMLHGIVADDRVGIISENRTEWVIADFAITAMGAVDVPIFPTLTSNQIEYIFNNCEAKCVFVSNDMQLQKVLSVRDAIPSIASIVVMHSTAQLPAQVYTFDQIITAGKTALSDTDRSEQFHSMVNRVKSDDLLTIIYTSGTTGNPKGVKLSHDNIMANIRGTMDVITIGADDTLLSFLPMCHSYERMGGFYLAFSQGATTYFAQSIESVASDILEIHPTVMTSVPRLFERIQARVLANVARSSKSKQWIFSWAMDVGERYIDGNRSISAVLQYKLANRLVYSKIKARTGGRLKFFASGGAPLSVSVGRFFQIIGVTILEGYGLTETSPVLCVNRLGSERIGTVGPPIANVEIRIADDGEILARGPNIMMGYWMDEAATNEIIDADGWLHTGDIGEIDEQGRVKITDRKKHILVSSGGKNIAPFPIEALIMQSELIDQAILIGDNRDFCTALLVVDKDAVTEWYTSNGMTVPPIEVAIESIELRKAVERDLNTLLSDVAKYERVRRFCLLSDPFTVENGLLTPTLKVRRKYVIERYFDLIEGMYK